MVLNGNCSKDSEEVLVDSAYVVMRHDAQPWTALRLVQSAQPLALAHYESWNS